jgi:hypothetical protein
MRAKSKVKNWEIIADNLSKAGWRCSCISRTDHEGRQIWVVAAERAGSGRFIVRADEKLTAFVELESATRLAAVNTVYLQTTTMSKRRRTTER